jgi:hypothetical protein
MRRCHHLVKRSSRMIPYDLDPSLHTGEPEPPSLDDGFSPPHDAHSEEDDVQPAEQLDPLHWTKSAF